MKKYKSREYCKDIKCYNQLQYDNDKCNKEQLNSFCEDCDAYKFHKWLQKNGYQIVKPSDGGKIVELVDEWGGGNENVPQE